MISKLHEVWGGLLRTWRGMFHAPLVPPPTVAVVRPGQPDPPELKRKRPGAAHKAQARVQSQPAPQAAGEALFADLPLVITPAIRKRMRADAARLLPAQAQPSASQWKMIFSTAISTCVVAGAGSGKSSSLVLRIVLLNCYLGIPLDDISVVTFTRASREDFAQRLVRLLGLWGKPVSLSQARSRVTTFHATVLAWARTLPGFAQVQAFESLGGDEGASSPFQLRVNERQRELLNQCFRDLSASDPTFAASIQTLRLRARQLTALPASHPDVQKRLAALVPAAERDGALSQQVEAFWRAAGQWPLPGIDPQPSEHWLQGQRFTCHGYHRATGAWVMLGADPGMGSASRPGARMSVRVEWAVKRTLFQALFDKPLIWLDNIESAKALTAPAQLQGPGFDYCLEGEAAAVPLLDAFVAMAGFIENLGLGVPEAAAALVEGQDGPFFEALGRYWPALERALLAQVPPVLTYNRMFALFSDPAGTALARVPAAKLTALRHLMVDEFQDISPQIARWLRSGLAERLKRDSASPASLMCVGDDWQSIYGWRGSSPAFFMEFASAFPAPVSRRLMLRENFRSTQQVIDSAEFIVKKVPSITGKKAVAAGPCALAADAPRVQLRDLSAEHVAQVAQAAVEGGASVLLLYRQAKDDPRQQAALQPLLQAQAELPAAERRLRCMTLHASKGLEADVVILLGDCTARPGSPARNRLYSLAGCSPPSGASADGIGPYDRAQADEALRLAYVGITRAAREVHWYLEPLAKGRGLQSAAAQTAGAAGLFEDTRA